MPVWLAFEWTRSGVSTRCRPRRWRGLRGGWRSTSGYGRKIPPRWILCYRRARPRRSVVGARADKGSSTDNTRTLKLSTRGDREMVLTRVFDALRRGIFDAYTKPELVRQWLLGPPGWSMPVCEIDLKVGGAYRYVWRRDSDGTEMGMGGVYREIVLQERIVSTEVFEKAWYPGEALGTLLFAEVGGKTTVTQTVLYQSREAREGVLKSDMESGVAASYDRLAQLVESPRTAGAEKGADKS